MKYLVVYEFVKDGWHPAHGHVEIDYQKLTSDLISQLRKEIRDDNKFDSVVIINFIKLEDE